ncbi:MAG: DUF928 domain-containing protein [Cyanobacteria bacterium P01_F01_bin.86]
MIFRITSLIALSSVLLSGTVEPSLAQSADHISPNGSTFQFNPPDSGLPVNTTGGASRNPNLCRRQNTATQASNIMLLAPTSFVGLTVSEHPDLFLYADQTLARQLFVSLEDNQGEVLYQGFQTLTTDTGLIPIELPADTPNLEMDRIYQFSVVAMCEESLRPDDPIMTTYVQRVSTPRATTLETQASFYDQAVLYADAGIWYDTLISLAAGLRNEPENEVFTVAWESLLMSGGLTDVEVEIDSPKH